jgi:glycerol-3-phosphate acyltransferase PlsY|tara:strand:- start:4040 stop:4627 length:588 start_codon:yes stop_codon:yes gene_type:complete
MNYELILVICLSYLCGSIPFGILLSILFKKKDPRKIGSKNIGATNVLRSGGWKLAVLTLFFDILKGFIPINIIITFNQDLLGVATMFVILGHIFPFWLKFKGGKGVATFIGVLLAYDIQYFLIFIITWLFSALIFRFSSLSAILAIVVNLIIVINVKENYFYFLITSLMILLKHSSNFSRLIKGEESKILLKKKN